MQKFSLIILLFMSLSFAGTAVELDSFEDGNINEKPSWWIFGASTQEIVNADMFRSDPLGQYLGKKSLKISGYTNEWYIGGMGHYMTTDATKVTHLKIYVHGSGKKSGKIRIQLYDDDNRNYKIEQDEANDYVPLFDDRFEYVLKVNWTGWKMLHIALADFKDTNPKVGDNTWNPNTKNGSGGLLHFQLIYLAEEEKGNINVYLDNIKLVHIKKKDK